MTLHSVVEAIAQEIIGELEYCQERRTGFPDNPQFFEAIVLKHLQPEYTAHATEVEEQQVKIRQLKNELLEMHEQRRNRDSEIQQLKAAIVVKDEALKRLRIILSSKHPNECYTSWPSEDGGSPVMLKCCCQYHIIDDALATNPGAELLEEMAELRKDKERLEYLFNRDELHIGIIRVNPDESEDWLGSREELDAAMQKGNER